MKFCCSFILSCVFLLGILSMLESPVRAQKSSLSPGQTALAFYNNLRDKKYLEGFKYSVYAGAVEGLSPEELKDLEPEFARTFSAIPEKIEVQSENVTGDTASVVLKFAGMDEPQTVGLILVDGKWLVGDRDSLKLVQADGNSFFFNTKMEVQEEEAAEMVSRISGAEFLYNKSKGSYATFDELVKMGGIPKDLADGSSNGYYFRLTVSDDRKTYYINAEPVQYGRSGRLSFYGDESGVHAQDVKGKAATPQAPIFKVKS